MRKRAKKLALSRETVRHLQGSHLHHIRGAESGTCPTDCQNSDLCPPQTNGCPPGGTGCTCTCPPTSFIEGSCSC